MAILLLHGAAPMTRRRPGPALDAATPASFALSARRAPRSSTVGRVALGTAAFVRLSDARSAILDQVGAGRARGAEPVGALVNQETGVRGFGSAAATPSSWSPTRRAGRPSDATWRPSARAGRRRSPAIAADLEAVEAAVDAWRSDYAQPVLDRRPCAPDPDQGEGAVRRGARDEVDRCRPTSTAQRDGGARAGSQVAANSHGVGGGGRRDDRRASWSRPAFGLRRSVLRPVLDLAAQVRGGRVRRRAAARWRAAGPREIVELGADVDAMRRRILRDLEASRDANRLLDEQAQELERSNRDLEQFAYVA